MEVGDGVFPSFRPWLRRPSASSAGSLGGAELGAETNAPRPIKVVSRGVPEILYPEYRTYVASRVEVNDAMMALLAGSRLAAHTLSLTAGSTATLKQLFPAVPHIERFDLRSDAARDLLYNADHHIASVAVPYALATHEDFVVSMLGLLKNEGRTLVTGGKRVRAWNMHTVLFDTCGAAEPPEWMQSFHVLREMRNCITHEGGGVSQELRDAVADMDVNARSGWQRLNQGFPPEDVEQNGRLVLTAEHIFTAFAVTKRLGREVNAALAGELTSAEWAKIVVEDFASVTSKVKNSSAWRRGLVGYARQNYGAASVTEQDLEAAARHRGFWTLPRWN